MARSTGQPQSDAPGRLRAVEAGVDSNPDDKEPVQEVIATYVTDRIDEALGSGRLDSQLWASSSTFLPAAAAKNLDGVNLDMNDRVSAVLKRALAALHGDPGAAGMLSGISADLLLAPISKPLGEAKETVEIVGLCIAVLAMQPVLAVACAKAMLHSAITNIMEKSIISALNPLTATAEADEAKNIAEVESGVAQQAMIEPASTQSTAVNVATSNKDSRVKASLITPETQQISASEEAAIVANILQAMIEVFRRAAEAQLNFQATNATDPPADALGGGINSVG